MGQSLITHSIRRQKSHCAQSLVEDRIIEDIGSRKEIHSPVRQFETDAERVVETVLMVGYDNCGCSVYGDILQSQYMFLLEIQSGIDELKVGAECL